MVKKYYIVYGFDDLDNWCDFFLVVEDLRYALELLNYIKELYENRDFRNDMTSFDWYGIDRIIEDIDTDNIRLVSRKTVSLIHMIPDKGRFIVRFSGTKQESRIFDNGEKIDYVEEW